MRTPAEWSIVDEKKYCYHQRISEITCGMDVLQVYRTHVASLSSRPARFHLTRNRDSFKIF